MCGGMRVVFCLTLGSLLIGCTRDDKPTPVAKPVAKGPSPIAVHLGLTPGQQDPKSLEALGLNDTIEVGTVSE